MANDVFENIISLASLTSYDIVVNYKSRIVKFFLESPFCNHFVAVQNPVRTCWSRKSSSIKQAFGKTKNKPCISLHTTCNIPKVLSTHILWWLRMQKKWVTFFFLFVIIKYKKTLVILTQILKNERDTTLLVCGKTKNKKGYNLQGIYAWCINTKSRTTSLKEDSHTVILKVAHIPIANFFFIAARFINRLL